MNRIAKDDWDRLLSDAGYLLDELKALKGVISAVPSRDRPAGQPSVIDMITEAGFRQANYCIPVVCRVIGQDFKETGQIQQRKSFFTKSNKEIRNQPGVYEGGGESGNTANYYSEDYINFNSNYFDPRQYDEWSIDDIIDAVSDDRKRLLELLKAGDPESECYFLLSPKEGEKKKINLYMLLTDMLEFERRQIKLMAERILSFESERNTGF